MRGPSRLALAFGLVLIVGAGLSAAQDQTFVCIEGVKAESNDPAHTDWIDAYGIDHGAVGSPTGAAMLTDVAFLKGTDRSTPKLHEALVKGMAFPKVVIDVCSTVGGASDCYYTVILQTVRVTQIDVAGSACVDPGSSCTPPQTESVSLSFERITWRTETPSGTVQECWNLQTNTSCATTPSSSCSP